MSVTINITYEGQLHCKAVHGPSGTVLHTDAPTDNHGKGESFSPTDLAAAALGTCFLTVMGIVAQREGIKLEGTTARVEKHMSTDKPRRIVKLDVVINMASGIPVEKRNILEDAARNCPTAKSINPDIEANPEFNYPD